jgi:hypothetical protein
MVVKFFSLIHVGLREDLEHAHIGDLQIELHEDVVELLKANGATISCKSFFFILPVLLASDNNYLDFWK